MMDTKNANMLQEDGTFPWQAEKTYRNATPNKVPVLGVFSRVAVVQKETTAKAIDWERMNPETVNILPAAERELYNEWMSGKLANRPIGPREGAAISR